MIFQGSKKKIKYLNGHLFSSIKCKPLLIVKIEKLKKNDMNSKKIIKKYLLSLLI